MKRQIKIIPDSEYLRACLRYDVRTGKLYWQERPLHHFVTLRVCSWWNSRYANKEAFTAVNPQGYLFGSLDDEPYLAHRVIWKLVTGREPASIIDHKNRDYTNNRFSNLREASKSQNNINSAVKRGIYFDKGRHKWEAHIKINGKRKHLGRYITEQEALRARKAAAQELFGEFAP